MRIVPDLNRRMRAQLQKSPQVSRQTANRHSHKVVLTRIARIIIIRHSVLIVVIVIKSQKATSQQQ